MPVRPSLIVHGGASNIPSELHQPSLDGVRQAAEIAWEILNNNGSALDAVEQAVRSMEDDPAFDAGRGSHLNTEGHIQLDALIMDGSTLHNGAVAAVERIANPITLARHVLVSNHALLVGEGALIYAQQMGLPLVDERTLIVERELELWRTKSKIGASDTVGAVARDTNGNIAIATSTGGTPYKPVGRIGDSPLIGCGGYADNLLGGASSTGVGEDLMKVVMAKTTCDLIGFGHDAQSAAGEAITRLSDPRIKGQGGVICIDTQGRVGMAHNTPYMARAYVLPNGSIVAEL